MRRTAPPGKGNVARSSRSQLSIISAFQQATSLEDFAAARTRDSTGRCSAVAPDDLRDLIRSELSRMNEIKFSLVSNQISDSVLDSMMLSEVIPPNRLRQTDRFFSSRILPSGHFLLKQSKIVTDARNRLAGLSRAAQPPPIKSALRKPGQKRTNRGERHVRFVFDADQIPAKTATRRRTPKNRIRWGQQSDYETALIEEIRAEANLARKIHQDIKRQRSSK
jgi:hypothetical protein